MDTSLNENCCLNKLVLSTLIRKAMREKKGAYNIDYDLADYIAEHIASEIPSHVLFNRGQLRKLIRHLEKSNRQLKKIMTKPTPRIVKTFTIDNRNQE